MSKLEELTERIVNLEILVFILMYRNKPIRVNGVNIAENSYTKDLIKRIKKEQELYIKQIEELNQDVKKRA